MPRNTQSADDLIALLRDAAVEASQRLKIIAWHPAIESAERGALFSAIMALDAAIVATYARPRRKRTVKIKGETT